MRTLAAALALAALVSAGCGNNSSNSTSPTTVVQLTITGASSIAGIGGTDQLSAIETLANGTQQLAANPTWTSSNTAIATISSTGLVTAVGLGQVTITVTDASITVTGTVSVVPNFTGTWIGTTVNGAATSTLSLVLAQTGSNLGGSASMTRTGGDSPFSYTASFSASVTGVTMTWNLIVSGSTCTGSVSGTATMSGATTLLFSPASGNLSAVGNGCTVAELTAAPGTTLSLTKQ